MDEHLQPAPIGDRVWFTLHPGQPFRFRQAYLSEARAAGVQAPSATAVVFKSCQGDFLVVASGRARRESAAAAVAFAEATGRDPDIAAELGSYLPSIRPDVLAHAAARLLRLAPACPFCGCAVGWVALLAGVAAEVAPAGGPGLAALEEAWSDAQRRLPEGPYRTTDPHVADASAAIREIGRYA